MGQWQRSCLGLAQSAEDLGRCSTAATSSQNRVKSGSVIQVVQAADTSCRSAAVKSCWWSLTSCVELKRIQVGPVAVAGARGVWKKARSCGLRLIPVENLLAVLKEEAVVRSPIEAFPKASSLNAANPEKIQTAKSLVRER